MRGRILTALACLLSGTEMERIQEVLDPVPPPLMGSWGCSWGRDAGPWDAPRYNQRKARKLARRMGRRVVR